MTLVPSKRNRVCGSHRPIMSCCYIDRSYLAAAEIHTAEHHQQRHCRGFKRCVLLHVNANQRVFTPSAVTWSAAAQRATLW
jgi:hypothetical protein